MVRHAPLKRIFDIIFSLSALCLLSPLFLLLFIAIRLTSKGPSLYKQTRLGRGGIPFTCFKFRTMHIDADDQLEQLLSQNPSLKEEWEKHQKLKKDPRVFLLGKILRMTSLDELPQLWNVLRGELSIVGPRPYMLSQQPLLGRHMHKILSVRPGLTGLWQTSGRSSTSFEERIRLDAEYVDLYSFGSDLFLIAKTFMVLFSVKNAC
jgi:undecaprenyl-phosphate galactose phosphotransferase